MKIQPLLLAAFGVLVVILWLQGQRTAAEVEHLRAQQQVLVKNDARSSGMDAATRRQSGAEEPAQANELAAAHARIEALEQDLASVVDSLNTAIDRLNSASVQAERARQPAWGAGQAVGEPDTMTAGDQRTAWAPATSDGGSEWLQLGYENAVEIAQVRVRETCGAGCIAKVAAILEGGREVVIWQGRHDASDGIVDAPFSAPPGLMASGVKVYLDTARVPGWNEIDAVELIGRDGSRQWASTSSASSSYGGGGSAVFSGEGTPLNLQFTSDKLSR